MGVLVVWASLATEFVEFARYVVRLRTIRRGDRVGMLQVVAARVVVWPSLHLSYETARIVMRLEECELFDMVLQHFVTTKLAITLSAPAASVPGHYRLVMAILCEAGVCALLA